MAGFNSLQMVKIVNKILYLRERKKLKCVSSHA